MLPQVGRTTQCSAPQHQAQQQAGGRPRACRTSPPVSTAKCRHSLSSSYSSSRHHTSSAAPTVTAAAATSTTSSSSSSSAKERYGDVRPMPIKIITVSKGGSRAATELAEEWTAKLRRYTQVTHVTIKPNPKRAADPQQQKEAEAEKVLKAIAPGERLVLCDERGALVTSPQVAHLLAAAGEAGTPLVFCIGGPFGHGPSVAARADTSISFSGCVLNHAVAHVVLMEQLYRGWTILRGEPYHH